MERPNVRTGPSIVRATHENMRQSQAIRQVMSVIAAGMLATAGILTISHGKEMVNEAITRKSGNSKQA